MADIRISYINPIRCRPYSTTVGGVTTLISDDMPRIDKMDNQVQYYKGIYPQANGTYTADWKLGEEISIQLQYTLPFGVEIPLLVFNESGYIQHGEVEYKDIEKMPRMSETEFHGSIINEPIRLILKNLIQPTAYKLASEYKDIYVFCGKYDRPNSSEIKLITSLGLQEKIFDYIHGHHDNFTRDELRFCTYCIVLSACGLNDEKLKFKIIELESEWIKKRTQDPDAISLHIENLSKIMQTRFESVLPPIIYELAENIASALL